VFEAASKWIPAGIAHGITSGMPEVHRALAGVPTTIGVGSASIGGIPGPRTYGGAGGRSAGGSGVVEVHTHVHLDGRQIYTSVQTQALRHQARNGANGLVHA
jgi:hypothetical protein